MSAKWLVFSDGAHLVDGDNAVCGAKVDVSNAQRYGARPVSLKTCAECVKAAASKAPPAAPVASSKKKK